MTSQTPRLPAFLLGLCLSLLCSTSLVGAQAPEPPQGPVRRPGLTAPVNGVLSAPRLSLPGQTQAPAVQIGEPGLSFRHVRTIGETGKPYLVDTVHLNRPTGLFVDDSDNLFVLEFFGGRMLRYAATGQVTLEVGRPARCDAGEYTFCELRDMALDADGNYWLVDRASSRAVQYSTEGTYIQQFPANSWVTGSDNGHFNSPSGIAFDSTGRMFVSDANNHRVQVFDMSADAPVYEATVGIGTAGSGSGQFNAPSRIAIDGNDRLLVADFGNDRVQRCIEAAGAWTCSTLDAGLNNPDGIAVDKQNNVYIADRDNFRIRKCAAGGVCNTWAEDTYWITDLAVDSSGGIYAAAEYERIIVRYNAAGTQLSIFAGVQRVPYATDGYHYFSPTDVAVDSDGNLLVVEEAGQRVTKLNAAGVVLWSVGDPGNDNPNSNIHFNWPTAIAVNKAGAVFVADTDVGRIQIYNKDGKYAATLGTGWGSGDYQFDWAKGVAVDGSGRIYVADAGNHRVQIYTSTRQFIGRIGVTGECGAANDHLCWPTGVAVDTAGNIYVFDAGNARVQKFDRNRVWQMTIGVTGSGGYDFGRFSNPEGIAVDAKGRIYVADAGNNRTQVFDANGAFLAMIGGWGEADGRVKGPAGIAVDSVGSVYIADTGNFRIQRFAPGVPGWRQVNITAFGEAQTVGIMALEVFKGQMYAGTMTWDNGAGLWRTSDGTTWTRAAESGFGSPGTNQAIIDMVVFEDRLYASTGWGNGGGQLWRTPDGATWERVDASAFGPNLDAMAALTVWNDQILACTHNKSDGLAIWRSSTGDLGNWTRMLSEGNGDHLNNICTGFASFDGYLYTAVENPETGVQIWRSLDGASWEAVVTGGFGDADTWVGGFAVLNGELFVGTLNNTSGSQIWRSANGVEWTRSGPRGLGDENNLKPEGLVVFREHLYTFQTNLVTGIQVWRSPDGIHWTKIAPDGFGDSNTTWTLWSSGVAVFNDVLHVGTSADQGSGGKIWQMLDNVYLPQLLR